jgi:hypothetical protein
MTWTTPVQVLLRLATGKFDLDKTQPVAIKYETVIQIRKLIGKYENNAEL